MRRHTVYEPGLAGIILWALLSVTAAGQERFEALARQCATELPWVFDLKAAAAAGQSRRVLVYVRCVNDRRGFEEARHTLEAAGVPLRDDGYRKDLLFRACVLADREVQDLVRERFVPVCLTYHFDTHGKGRGDLDWSAAGRTAAGLAFDPEAGATEKGSLRLDAAGAFLQSLVRPPMEPGTYRLEARIRTRDGPGTACVQVLWTEAGRHGQTREVASAAAGDTQEWKHATCTFSLEAAPVSILVMPTLRGGGTAWFDDLALRRLEDGRPVGPNLLRNGGVDPDAAVGDPLATLGVSATDTVTPALLLVEGGRVIRKLHRIGAMAPDYVARWLRSVSDASGDATTPDPPEDERLLEVRELLLDGAWSEALERLGILRTEGGVREGQFWEGLCLHRLGRQGEARERWEQAAGPTRWGRRAAACLLERGPHPPLALSARRWPAPRDGSTTEGTPAFDGQRALRILLELQDADGGFSDHGGTVVGSKVFAPWKPAYTAIALRALLAWEAEEAGLSARRRVALERARSFLVSWARSDPKGRLGAFNHPYALRALLDIDEREAAQRVIAAILAAQAKDGSWSVYGPDRPTSFNTAQAILGLVRAREAGLAVPSGALDAACAALERMRSGDALFPYSPKPGHEWMTTESGSIARDPLCEHALLRAGHGDAGRLAAALERFLHFHGELRLPVKHYSSDFDLRGHGSYFFLFGLHQALEAAELVQEAALRSRVASTVRAVMLASCEKDGSALDHAMYGRAYGTAMALLLLAPD